MSKPEKQNNLDYVDYFRVDDERTWFDLPFVQPAAKRTLDLVVSVFGLLLLSPLLLLIALLETIVLLIANVLGRGKATFRQLWCAVMNILVIAGMATVVLGAITLLRGPDDFNTMNDVYRAMPSLAMLAPNAATGLLAFLSGISIFSIWATVLTGMAMRIIAGTSAILSYAFAILILFLSALIPAFFASRGNRWRK